MSRRCGRHPSAASMASELPVAPVDIDGDGFRIGAIVEDADDGVALAVSLPFVERGRDRRMAAVAPPRDQMHIGGEVGAYQPGAAPIGAAAQIGRETVVIGDLDRDSPERARGRASSRPRTTSMAIAVRRGLRPDGEVAADDLRGGNLDAIDETR